jgi:hypothetical protein
VADKAKRVDPGWPRSVPSGSHAVSEFNADRQGALSPFGDEEFPLDPKSLGYHHPTTVINR